MSEVFLTVGQRGAGKSHFCERVLAEDPSLVFVSRDEILVEMFGTTTLDGYSGGHAMVFECMWKMVAEAFQRDTNVRLILDVWSGASFERRAILRHLRALGAEHVTAWYFTTPLELVDRWFWQKSGIAKIGDKNRVPNPGERVLYYPADAPRRDHELFHRLANLDSDGFDAVVRIDPITTDPASVFVDAERCP